MGINKYLFLLAGTFYAISAGAVSGMTYHGRILRSNGNPVEGSAVGFRIHIMDGNTGTCEMYQETQTKDMRNSGGVFAFTIGDGSVAGTMNVAGATYFDEIFSNNKTFSFLSPAGCVATPYSASVRDGRKLLVQFRESPSDPWEDLPMVTVNYVPFAFNSLVANQVGSHTSASLLRVETSGAPQSVAALTTTNYTDLITMLSNISGLTAGTYGSATQVPVITVDTKGRVTAVSTAAISGSGSAGISALTGDVTASGSGSVAATIANNAVTTAKVANANITYAKIQNVGAGKILGNSTGSAATTEEISIGTGLSLAAGTLSATGSDTFAGLPCGNGYLPYRSAGAWTCIQAANTNTASTLVQRDASGNFTAGAGTFNTSVVLTDGAAGGQLTLSAPTAFTSYSLKLPSADGSSGQVLKTDGSGNLGWISPVTSATGYLNGGNAFGANASIGLTDAFRLDFKTSNSTRMSIDSSGNVGIGTSSPQRALHVVGSGILQENINDAYGSHLKFYKDRANAVVQSGDELGNIDFMGYDGSAYTTGALVSALTTGSASSGVLPTALTFSVRGSSGGTSERMRIDGSGNVGIGTTTPAAALDVGSGQIVTTSRFTHPSALSNGLSFDSSGRPTFLSSSGGAVWAIIKNSIGASGSSAMLQFDLGSVSSGSIQSSYSSAGNMNMIFTTRGSNTLSEVMRLTAAGKVGIGTTSPGAKVDVAQNNTGSGALQTSTSGTAFWKVVNPTGSAGISWNSADAVMYVGDDSVTNRSINASGTINASGADFAEWIDWSGPKPEMGSVVLYRGSYVVVSSPSTAAFIGNDVKDPKHSILIAFAGQLPVLVRGHVQEGDLIVAGDDGTARAVPKYLASVKDAYRAVGTAWSSSNDPGLKRIHVAVGIGLAGGLGDIDSMSAQIIQVKKENQQLKQGLSDLKSRLEKLERLAQEK